VVVCRAELDDDDGQDYVYKLAAAVRALAPEAYDSHLFALEVRLRELDRASVGDSES